ncbi:RNA polymerase primary sigma factor [Microlunatus sagamiharensis]|uniref:RNA polymerase primary sigma factor n=1 Tax=Microlunatus sagamiharensis TaxID=546874 RepID=A0A1H2MID0_9ACTN|nr:sigma-70 family RNA polymerase sigma factor [Microlunatus sagamiharensis]SDU92824.1 RNA polymerase primary sigma factor [Microlunatus sagamiharensis]
MPAVTTPAPDDLRTVEVAAWAQAVEAGVLARAALDDPAVPWRGDAADEELRVLESLGAAAQQEFVAANLGLVGAVVARYGGAAAHPDLFQEGCLGLIAAVERFDHRRGVRFSTFATYGIRAAVGTAATRFVAAVTMPASRSGQLRAARGVEAALVQELGRQPGVAEVAAALGREVGWTARLLGQRAPRSLDALDDETLHRLSGRTTGTPGSAEDGDEPAGWSRGLLASLDGFDRSVIELRMGFDGGGPSSLSGVARRLGVPLGRVRRAEVRALGLLRSRCSREALAEVGS